MNSGIYKISNTVDQRFYIGSSAYLNKRMRQHKCDLLANRHANKMLQRFTNKYGVDTLVFSIIELCEQARLVEREQYYIDSLLPEFNISKVVDRPMLGRKHSQETLDKLSEINKQKASTEKHKQMFVERMSKSLKHTDAWKEKMSEVMKGRVISDEARRKMSIIRTGKQHTEESRKKMSEQRKGKPKSEAHIAKWKEAMAKRREMSNRQIWL